MSRMDEVMVVVDKWWMERWCSPTVRELGEELGCEVSTVFYHLGRLRDAGRILPGKRVVPVWVMEAIGEYWGRHTIAGVGFPVYSKAVKK